MLFGQNTTAVGRTGQVTGGLKIEGTQAVSGSFTVDLASVRSDSDQRDSQFRGRVMNTERYPDATFELAEPVDFGSVPDVNEQVTGEATGISPSTARPVPSRSTSPPSAPPTASG